MWKDTETEYRVTEVWRQKKVQFGPSHKAYTCDLHAEVVYTGPLFERRVLSVGREHMYGLVDASDCGPESLFEKTETGVRISSYSSAQFRSEYGLDVQLYVAAVMLRTDKKNEQFIAREFDRDITLEQARSLPIRYMASASIRGYEGDQYVCINSFNKARQNRSCPVFFANIPTDESQWLAQGYTELTTREDAKVYAGQLAQLLIAEENLALEAEYAARKQGLENALSYIMGK